MIHLVDSVPEKTPVFYKFSRLSGLAEQILSQSFSGYSGEIQRKFSFICGNFRDLDEYSENDNTAGNDGGVFVAVEDSFGNQMGARRVPKVVSVYRWVGALLLLLIGYIHLAILVNMFGLSQNVGKLFLLNAVGAVVAIILLFLSPKWYGWVLGILVAGGAAFAKSFMTRIPGLAQFIMGRRGRGFRPPGGGRQGPSGSPSGGGHTATGGASAGHASGSGSAAVGGAHGAHFAGVTHGILPMFSNVRTLGSASVVIEIAFVVLALVALITMGFTPTGLPSTSSASTPQN